MTETDHVLVVEDDDGIRDLLAYKLRTSDYEVTAIDDGADCLEALEEGELEPDAVVLDVMLPGVDGYEVLERLREHARLADVPVIMVTGMGLEANVVRGFEAGADDYVTKPFSPSELVARLGRLCR